MLTFLGVLVVLAIIGGLIYEGAVVWNHNKKTVEAAVTKVATDATKDASAVTAAVSSVETKVADVAKP